MKKLNELLAERADLITAMEAIVANTEMNEELRSQWSENDAKVVALDTEIALLQRQEDLNKTNVRSKMETTITTPTAGVAFREFLNNAVNNNGSTKFELRADPIITTTDADLIPKAVAGIDVLTAPGEAFLRSLGVSFFPNLQGAFSLPSMSNDLATFPGEDASAASADMLPDSLVLNARRVTHTQSISVETLNQTSPAVYTTIVQALQDGIWNAIVKDWAATIVSDGASRITTTGTTLTYANLVNQEASIGGLSIGSAAYLTTPAGKAFMKKTIALGTTAGAPIWDGNTVNGYNAVAAPQLAANKVVFGDFSKTAIGQWGNGIQIIVDPYTNAKKGLINLTALALVDTGLYNPRAIAIVDASFA